MITIVLVRFSIVYYPSIIQCTLKALRRLFLFKPSIVNFIAEHVREYVTLLDVLNMPVIIINTVRFK